MVVIGLVYSIFNFSILFGRSISQRLKQSKAKFKEVNCKIIKLIYFLLFYIFNFFEN